MTLLVLKSLGESSELIDPLRNTQRYWYTEVTASTSHHRMVKTWNCSVATIGGVKNVKLHEWGPHLHIMHICKRVSMMRPISKEKDSINCIHMSCICKTRPIRRQERGRDGVEPCWISCICKCCQSSQDTYASHSCMTSPLSNPKTWPSAQPLHLG